MWGESLSQKGDGTIHSIYPNKEYGTTIKKQKCYFLIAMFGGKGYAHCSWVIWYEDRNMTFMIIISYECLAMYVRGLDMSLFEH